MMHALQPRGAHASKRVTWAQLLGEDAAKTAHFASNLRDVFQPSTEPLTMEVAAAALGHLVRSGGALTADVVEFEARTFFSQYGGIYSPSHAWLLARALYRSSCFPHCRSYQDTCSGTGAPGD